MKSRSDPASRSDRILARKARRRICTYCNKKEGTSIGKDLVEVPVPAPEGEDRGKFLIHSRCRGFMKDRQKADLQERERKRSIEDAVMIDAARAKVKKEAEEKDPWKTEGGIVLPKTVDKSILTKENQDDQ